VAVDFYALLEVPEDASQEEIKDAFREKVQEYHPDHNDDPRANAQFTALKKAYDTLGDPVERNAYDRMGHGSYVAKRLSGLPDPEKWAPEDRSGDPEEETTSRDQPTGPGSTGRGTVSGPPPGGSATGSSTGGSGASSGTGSDRSGGSRASRSNRSGSTSGGRTDSSGPSHSRSTSSGGAGSAAASGGASGTGGNRTSARTGGSSRAGESSGGGGSVAYADDPIVDWIARHDWARRIMGWPLLYVVTLVYAAGLATFVGFHAEAVLDLADRIGAAGVDTDALGDALERESLPTVFDATLGEMAGGAGDPSVAAPGVLLGLGAISLPIVTFVLVYVTRLSPGWQPTYLYALAVLGPALGLAGGAVTDLSLAVELAAFVVVPFGGLLVMVSSAFLRPRLLAALS